MAAQKIGTIGGWTVAPQQRVEVATAQRCLDPLDPRHLFGMPWRRPVTARGRMGEKPCRHRFGGQARRLRAEALIAAYCPEGRNRHRYSGST